MTGPLHGRRRALSETPVLRPSAPTAPRARPAPCRGLRHHLTIITLQGASRLRLWVVLPMMRLQMFE